MLGGGFDLWLDDNIAILSMVKRAHLLFRRTSWYSQQAKTSSLSFWSKSKVDQVKTIMTYSMKSENKLEGASNFRAWKIKD
jgi:hypothetical protein